MRDRTGSGGGSARTVIDPSAPKPTTRSEPAEVSPWLAGLWAGLQALLLSYIVVVLPAMAAYVATSGDPSNAESGWTDAAAAGAAVWALGHGGTIATSMATFTIVPLGLSLLVVVLIRGCTRRSGAAQIESAIATTITYAVGVGLLILLTAPPSRGGIARAVLGAAILAAIGAGTAVAKLRRDQDPAARKSWWTPRLAGVGRRLARLQPPPIIRDGLRAGAITSLVLIVAGGLVVALWTVMNRDTVAELMVGLHADPIGAVALTLGQVMLLPNMVIWAASWVAGQGFAVGAGTVWSPADTITAPLPSIPILGMLPSGTTTGAAAVLVVALAAGAFGGWSLMRSRTTPWWHAVVSLGVLALTAGVLVMAVAQLSGGVAGPGRMAEIGPVPWRFGLLFAGEALLGGAVIVLPVALRRWARGRSTAETVTG